jgi:hypothetical protein
MKNNIAILFVLLSSLSLGAAKSEGEPPSPGRNDLKGLSAEAFVTWKGGPDLAVPYFIPPVIVNEERSIITLQDNTANLGSTSATASVTRYYLSDVEPPFDLTMARVVGERTIPILEAGAESRGPEIIVPFPADLSGEIYYLAACADAEATVVELNEQNNCSYSQLNSPRQVNVVAAMPPPNQPPTAPWPLRISPRYGRQITSWSRSPLQA